MEAESAGLAPAVNLTVAIVTAAVIVGQAATGAAAETVVTPVSEPEFETRIVICHEQATVRQAALLTVLQPAVDHVPA